MKTKVLLVVGMLVFALSGWSVYAHGTDTGMTGSTGMMEMMDLMHEQMDGNQALNCDTVSDMEMMEEGEEMMEAMMGHEDHERMEATLNQEDHDSMHMMMGMWSTGCVGEETANTLAVHYGFDDDMMGSDMVQNNWGMGGGGVTTLLVWAVLILAIIGLLKWIRTGKPGVPPTV